jgi:hypothetical protein
MTKRIERLSRYTRGSSADPLWKIPACLVREDTDRASAFVVDIECGYIHVAVVVDDAGDGELDEISIEPALAEALLPVLQEFLNTQKQRASI